MFTTTISMWLGVAFLVLAVAAVVLQAWLWGPQYWDEAAKVTRAPRAWLRVHAACGYLYLAIYLFMMWHMFPRLWAYQFELPARSVVHAVVALTIGVLIVTKLSILRFFRHFEEAMPKLGFVLLWCTVILTGLSVPYAIKAHDLSGSTLESDNIARTRRLLEDVAFDVEVDKDELVTARGFDRGRTILTTKCTPCHDMRTILMRPRTAQKWRDVTHRMLDKPAVYGERLTAEDVPWVTAYLVAITPDIQRSTKQRRESEIGQERLADAVGQAVHEGDDMQFAVLDRESGEAMLVAKCTECHELDEVAAHGGDDEAGWRSVVAAMVEEGADIDDTEALQLAAYCAQKWPTEAGAAVPTAVTAANGDAPRREKHGQAKDMPGPSGDDGDDDDDDDDDTATRPPERTEGRDAGPTPKAADDAGEGANSQAEGEPKPESEKKNRTKPRPKPQSTGDRAAGAALFQKKCKSCHGADGAGQTAYGIKIGAPDMTTSTRSRAAIRKVIVHGTPGTKMKGYGSKLSDQEIDDLTAFVKSL